MPEDKQSKESQPNRAAPQDARLQQPEAPEMLGLLGTVGALVGALCLIVGLLWWLVAKIMVVPAMVFLILAGAVFTFIGSLGLARLRDFYTRLHGPTKATTLGVGCLLLASSLYFSRDGVSLHEGLITLFLFITAPVSAHLLAKAALHQRLPRVEGTREARQED